MPQREAKPKAGALGAAARRLRGPATALLRRFGLAMAFVLAGLLGGLGYGLLAPTTYTATAFVLVVDAGDGQSGPAAVSFAQAYGRLAPLPETLEHSSIPLPRHAAGGTREHIQASTSPDTPLIRLAGSARTARDAAAFANAAADALVKYGTRHRADTGVRVALMTLAEPPAAPSSPNLVLDVAAGTASGILHAGLSPALMSGRRGARREWARHAAIPAPAAADRVEVRS
jgi:capsular polysaccharide biosynthesis protein